MDVNSIAARSTVLFPLKTVFPYWLCSGTAALAGAKSSERQQTQRGQMACPDVMPLPKATDDATPAMTPAKVSAPHLDSSLITSAIRKRKVEINEPQTDEKKARSSTLLVGLMAHAAGLQLPASPQQQQQQQLWIPLALTSEGACQAVHPSGQHHAGEEEEEAEVLFSPSFHVLHGHLPCVPGEGDGRGEEPSTDGSDSTGTSATLGSPGEDSLGGGSSSEARASAGSARGPASPLPLVAHAADASVSAEPAIPEEEEESYLDFDPFVFIKRLPPVEQCVPARCEFLLPRQTRRSKRKTLVLDLDETLVHSTLDGYCRSDFVFPVEVGTVRHMVSVRQRPHLHTFLRRMAQLFEVVVFTASQRVYAEQLLDLVDPGRSLIRHRVFRESCVFWEGNYLKDLTVLGRDLAHTVIVDNSPQAFGFQLDNGIPIESWYDDDGDDELLKLLPFLEDIAGVEDVRPHIQCRYRLRQLVEAAPDPPC